MAGKGIAAVCSSNDGPDDVIACTADGPLPLDLRDGRSSPSRRGGTNTYAK